MCPPHTAEPIAQSYIVSDGGFTTPATQYATQGGTARRVPRIILVAGFDCEMCVLLTPQSRFCVPRSAQMLVSPPLPHNMPPRGARQGGSHGSSWWQDSTLKCVSSSHRRADSAFLNHLRCWFHHPCHTICHPGVHGKEGPTDHHGDRIRPRIVGTPRTAEPILRILRS